MDYSIFYKEELPLNSAWNFKSDLFITAFNDSERCKVLCNKINTKFTLSVVLPEYSYGIEDIPKDTLNIKYFIASHNSEQLLIEDIFKFLKRNNIDTKNICIDITGFMRPQFLYLLNFLKLKKIKNVTILYAEPKDYIEKENTTFSAGSIIDTRQINGYEGDHYVGDTKEVLIIGSGYDYKLIQNVCDRKKDAEVIQLFGFPSLKADMIQQNILAANMAYYEIEDSLFWSNPNIYFSPANDPFITANVLSEIVNKLKTTNRVNIYLSPLSSKPQTLGFGLYYLWEAIKKPISILYPITSKYNRKTTDGISKIWKYNIELP